MKLSRLMPLACALIFAAALAGCSSDMNKNAGENAASPAASPGASPAAQTLTEVERPQKVKEMQAARGDRKSTRLNSSHANISYAVFCLKKKKEKAESLVRRSRRN